MTWEQIDTIPKDGRLYLVSGQDQHGNWHVMLAKADEDELKLYWQDGYPAAPTHWMEVPKPPYLSVGQLSGGVQ